MNMTKTAAFPVAFLVLCLAFLSDAAGAEERWRDELNCVAVGGYIQLPGITYDDLTPLAHQSFNSNTAAVTNALYSLPMEEREDFLTLYLEPKARERHRYFFQRCREVSDRRAAAARIDGSDPIPPALRRELQERERVKLALHEGAIPFRIAGKIVYIPIPFGYSSHDTPVPGFGDNMDVSNSLAVFRKVDPPAIDGSRPLVQRNIMATVKHVREGVDNLGSMLHAYNIMVDADWRLVSMYPPESVPGQAETVEYKWNLKPFGIKDNSFCYGQFEKTTDFHGVEQIRYRVTAVLMLPGSFIQVSIYHSANTSLDTVNEMNNDLTKWRDTILQANW